MKTYADVHTLQKHLNEVLQMSTTTYVFVK